MATQPAISIVLSVYNTKRYLKKCLDSLIHQTLQQIEVIAVDNGSNDGSSEILEQYKEKYPEKFRLISIEKNTGDPAEPWNIGIREARGEYISIVDSDDWCDVAMFEILLDSAKVYKSEMVLCDHFEVYGKNNYVRAKINAEPGDFDLQQLMLYPHMAPWGKIVKKDVYEKNKLKYKSQIHCDTGLNLVMYSFLKSVSYVDEPLYYYNKINPNSETNTKKRMRQAEIVGTLDHIMANYNRVWEDEVVFSVVRFLYWFCFSEYIFHQDIFTPFVKRYKILIRKNKYIRANREGLRIVLNYLDKELVPKRIIYCTFGKKGLSKLEQYCVNSWRKYTVGYEFIELNERNCNFYSIPEINAAFKNKRFDIVSTYFAMKELYDNGGIFLSTSMMLNGPIGELRTHSVTVGFDSIDSIGDGIISAVPRSPVIMQICEHALAWNSFMEVDAEAEDTYWMVDSENQGESFLSACLNNYFRSHNYPLTNQNMLLNNDILVLSTDRLYYEINQINLMYRVYPETFRKSQKPFIILHENAIKGYAGYINQIENQCRVLSSQLNEIKNSRSWRYMEPVRWIVRKIRLFKAKFQSCLRSSRAKNRRA